MDEMLNKGGDGKKNVAGTLVWCQMEQFEIYTCIFQIKMLFCIFLNIIL